MTSHYPKCLSVITQFILVLMILPVQNALADVFINELHYDNTGADSGEAVEVAGPAGTDLAGWSIALYNGSATQLNVYATINLSGVIPDQSEGCGTLSFSQAGIQNGSPDGLALVDAGSSVIQFLSYEGSFTAGSGPASGMTSTDIGVSEPFTTPIGHSLQLTGSGSTYSDFTWASAAANTFASPNTGQSFTTCESVEPSPTRLLISEIVVTPTAGEFIEIHNPGSAAVDLSDVYLTDATFAGGGAFYYNIVTGSNAGGGGFSDFHARFPDGASIPGGAYQTVSLAGSDDFFTTYGENPTYELFEDGGAPDGVADMREAISGSISNQGGLSNSGEVAILYTWDGASDLVQDLDYVVWGDKAEGVDKTGVSTDGPDGDSDTSSYLADTAIASQDVVATGSHSSGSSFSRADLDEGTETQTGGNGTAGNDETSENLSVTWRIAGVSPNAETPDNWVINEINADPAAGDAGDANGDGVRHFGNDEFVEIVNTSDADMDISGWTLSDNFTLRHIFPGGTVVSAGCTIVVFGGGAPTGLFGLGMVQTASTGALGLNNSGDSITLNDGSNDVVSASYGSAGGDNQSVTLDPDLTGTSFVKHSGASGSDGALWSPGTRIDGGQFSGCVGEVKIHDIQGSGSSTPIPGWNVIVEGIIVGDFQNGAAGTHGDLNGFFIQEEDADADGDAATSEGIFVFDGSSSGSPSTNVSMGDLVRVEGVVSEFGGLTELTSFSGVSVTSGGHPLPTASNVTLPVASISDLETVEGMRVTLPQDLTIVEYFNFDRFGEFVLATDRLIQPTALFEPSADPLSDRAMLADLNLRSRITVDDGRSAQNPDPAIHPNGAVFNLDNLFRGGDLVTDTTGVMSDAFGKYRVQPTQGATYTAINPRTAMPDEVGGGLKFASFNVLNYFSTLDNGVSICGPLVDQGCRGADNATEFTRQRDKIISAITAIGVDVVGLIEIENHINDDAVKDLVSGLNTATGAGTWDYVDTGTIGTDVIKQAFIYKPASVSELGSHAILDTSVDARFNDAFNRPALAQTFVDNSNGAVFTLVVNHLKSKGSSCSSLGDSNLGDGAGNCNLTRASAAQAMVDWLASDPTDSNDADIIVLGDLNAYDKEDPIVVFTDGGYTDMTAIFGGELAYGFVFSAEIGYLDYALASPGLLAQITGVTDWHINADEPDLINYDTSFKRPAQDAIYAPDAYRSSDHDPVIGGADLLQYDFGGFQPPVKAVPALNKAKAGQSIPMKFMLNDDYGLDIFAPGYPLSQEIDCDDLSVLGGSEATMSDGDIGLTYDAEEDQYKYVWKTSKAYKGSCRQFVIQLTDGGFHYANIKFK